MERPAPELTREFVLDLPKVELHVHLEGSTRPSTLLRLAERNRIEGLPSTLEGFEEFFRFTDFPHFVQVYVAITRCIRRPEDLRDLAYDFALGQAEQNVIHTEATFTALTVERECGLPWPEQRDALSEGFARAERETGASVRLILDTCRDFPAERSERNLGWVREAIGDGLVAGMGLSGQEGVADVEPHASVFRAAKEEGIPLAVHAGETRGPESVREALAHATPDRIGHGVRAMEDPALVRELVASRTPLEVCPTSNVRLGVFPSLARHPLPFMLEAGLNVSLNSDDPPMFGTTLTDEILGCARAFGLDSDMLFSLQSNAAGAAFLPAGEREELRAILRENWPD